MFPLGTKVLCVPAVFISIPLAVWDCCIKIFNVVDFVFN